MTPTTKLRLVERPVPASEHPDKVIRVLQQWWASDPNDDLAIRIGFSGEWRDVPLEVEE